VGQELAAEANRVMGTWSITVAPGWAGLKGVLSDSLSVAKDTLDLVGTLGGEKFPDLSAGVMSILKARLGQLVVAGQDLAAEANRVMGLWTITVAPGWTALKGVLADSLSIAKDTLDLVSTLGGEKFPDLGTGVMSTLKARLAQLIVAGQDLAVAANTAMGLWSITVAPGWAGLKGVLADSLSVAGDALDMVSTLGGEKFPDLSSGALSVMKDRLGQLIVAGQELAAAANTAMGTWTLSVAVGFNALKGVLSDSLGIIKDVLEFNDLKSKIAAFRPLDMTVFGSKIDLIILAAKEVAQRFAEKARAANISKDMQDAADALSKVFGNAASSIKGALDMAAQLLDPETQIPSIGQIDAKLTAVLNLVEAVTRRFADKAASVGPETAKSAEGLSNAVKSVFDAISQVIAAVKDAADLNLGTGIPHVSLIASAT
jgi:hypothetical protein